MAATPRVGIIANPSKEGADELLHELCGLFEKAGIEMFIDEDAASLCSKAKALPLQGLAASVDLLVVLGGDGTILWVVRQLKSSIKPVAAINTGTLGFLTCATTEEAALLVDQIAAGTYVTTPRSLVECELWVGDECLSQNIAANEVTLCRDNTARVVHVEAQIGERPINLYSGDGLILSTPTGSTAYSLSAGGPIVEPESDVFIITPICAHTLASRPLVVDDNHLVRFIVPEQRDKLSLLVDGQWIATIEQEAEIRMRKADFTLDLITMPDQDFYGVLHQKLNWMGSATVK